MGRYGPDAIVHAAEDAEEHGQWRHAYGFWKDVITEYGSSVSKDQREMWESHMKMCNEKMKE